MSPSSRSRIRNKFAKHLKKKSNNELKIQTGVSVRKDPVFIGEKSTKSSGKRKVFSDVGFEERVLRRKNGNEVLPEKNVKKGTIFSDDDDEENVGFRVLGKRCIVPNSSSSSSSSDDENGYQVIGKRIVRNGSCSKNTNFSRFRPQLVSNVVKNKSNKSVSSSLSSSSSSEDEGQFKFTGKRIVGKGSYSKNARVSRLRPRLPFVSNVVRDKNPKPVTISSSSSSDEDGRFVSNVVKDKNTKPVAISSNFSSDEDGRFVSNVVKDKNTKPVAISSSSSSDEDCRFVSNVVRDKKTKPVISSSSGADDDSEGELGENIGRNVSCSEKASDLRLRTPLVPNVVIGGNRGSVHSVGVISTHGFVENMGGDSEESVGRLDKKKDEIELSSDEEEDTDDAAEMESEEDALFSSGDDDSMDVPYKPSDSDVPSDNGVVLEKMLRSRDKRKRVNLKKNKSDIGTGNEQNNENDAVMEKPLRSGKKCEKVNLKRNENKRDTGTGAEENKGNGVIVEKPLRSGKKRKRENQEKDFSVQICKQEKDYGIEVMVNFDGSSDEEERCSKSELKDPHIGKSEPPKSVMECRILKDDESHSSRRECCNDSDKGEICSNAQKEDPQVGTFALLNPVIECEAPEDDESNSSKQECSIEKRYSCEAEVTKLCKSSARTRNDQLIRILLNAVNEAQNVEENTPIHEPLPLKFRFEDETKYAPEQTERDEEIDSLFLELNYCLQISEIDSANLSKNENLDATSKLVDESPAASCRREVHDPVLDEQIGNVCRFCSIILLEIKDILPPWYMPRSKRQKMKYFGELPNPINDERQPKNYVNGPNEPLRVRGTVWDLIPGIEKDLFQHQCEGFEFLWKNIAGDIAIEKLPASLSGEGRGCIISHAPSTGKTRLAVVFLLSFLERYPEARPVILAPQPILSTWENEFVKCKVSFHNMNNPKLLGNETRFGGGTKRLGVRLAKLLSWNECGGILGISYTLFGTLASKGENGGGDAAIWEALVKVPRILVLDEGHVPRNDNGCIGDAIKKVKTKRCIMLSGTPFQNNFEEFKTTLGLVDPNFHKMDKSSWAKLTEGKDELEEFRSRLDPYVHYYMGSLLEKSLPGLKDTIIFLRPSELQKKLMEACEKMEVFLPLTYSVSLISVHPSAVMVYKKGKFVKSPGFSLFKDKLEEIKSDYDEGVKIKFVMNLIQLADALGERVLVFSHFTYPLMFIKKQLETHFSWKEGSEVLYMDGKVEEKHRQQSMSSFNSSSSKAKVLLASLKACSEGINLVGASRVILLTTAWNPSVERQAISRAYRLGQEKVVHVYRLITSGMEVRQYELQAKKDQISQLIFSPVDEKTGEREKSSEILEKDNILEQMQNLESFKNIFEKIIYQPKESDFLENFRFKDL